MNEQVNCINCGCEMKKVSIGIPLCSGCSNVGRQFENLLKQGLTLDYFDPKTKQRKKETIKINNTAKEHFGVEE